MFYAIHLDSSGNGVGSTAYAEKPSSYPSNEMECTQAQAQNPTAWKVSGGVLVSAPVPVAQKAQAALAAGLPCTSSTDGTLNATYPLTDAMQNNLIALDHYYGKFNSFPNKATTVQLQDITGAAHTFTYAQFEALLQTLGDYRAALLDCIAEFSTTLPDPANFGTLP